MMSHQNDGACASLAVMMIIVASAILSCSASFAQESTELAFILSCNPIQNVPGADRARAHFDLSHVPGIKKIPPNPPFPKGGIDVLPFPKGGTGVLPFPKGGIDVLPFLKGGTGVSPFPKGGIKLLLIGAIRFYQLFISPQDMPACNFVPSCSQFGAEAIKRLGTLRGILLTSDRLQRCNSMSTSRYHIDHKSGKLVDPVRLYAEILR